MTHTAYVAAAYAVSVLAILGLICWILLDQSTQQRALKELEARGVRRRSTRSSQ